MLIVAVTWFVAGSIRETVRSRFCGVETRPPARPSAGGDLAQPGGSASLGPASVASKTDHAESVLSEKYFSACLIPASIVSLVS